jgi:formamidopyrimidine-DNA glycosylase
MPELPEVETVRRGLQPVLEGARIISVTLRRPDLRFPLPKDFAARLCGHVVVSLSRRAKFLVAQMDDGLSLICHMGMSGSFQIEDESSGTPGIFHHERSKDEAHDHVILHVLSAGGHEAKIIFNDPRRFGFMLLAEKGALGTHPMMAGLGIEPTGNALDGRLLSDLFKGKKAPLKAALMDQRLIAGLGNIYACEALWRARLSPRRTAGTLSAANGRVPKRAELLAGSIRAVIADAIDAGGSSLRNYVHADGSLGYFQHSFDVYDREGKACHHAGCGGTVTRIVQSGRSTFYCPHCQR